MKSAIFISLVVLSTCHYSAAWWGGGSSGKSKSKGTTADVRVEADNGGGATLSGEVNHQGETIGGGFGGSIDTGGNWDVGGGLSLSNDKTKGTLSHSLDSDGVHTSSLGISHTDNGWTGSLETSRDNLGNWDAEAGLSFTNDKTSFDLSHGLNSAGEHATSLGLSHKGKNWEAGVSGSIDSNGNAQGMAGLKINFKKRSVDMNGKHYTVMVKANECDFDVYDLNRDEIITVQEMEQIFGNEDNVIALFNALDMTTGDGKVDRQEFQFMVPLIIKGCETDI